MRGRPPGGAFRQEEQQRLLLCGIPVCLVRLAGSVRFGIFADFVLFSDFLGDIIGRFDIPCFFHFFHLASRSFGSAEGTCVLLPGPCNLNISIDLSKKNGLVKNNAVILRCDKGERRKETFSRNGKNQMRPRILKYQKKSVILSVYRIKNGAESL